jgi:hypothetical protein
MQYDQLSCRFDKWDDWGWVSTGRENMRFDHVPYLDHEQDGERKDAGNV